MSYPFTIVGHAHKVRLPGNVASLFFYYLFAGSNVRSIARC
ncbi:hypothetical protein NOR53_3362 [gamma proteobacterium NOR5-3]|nr:hypothetical protein NOR53_3362 [gamma proteobacterium NOR5-3]